MASTSSLSHINGAGGGGGTGEHGSSTEGNVQVGKPKPRFPVMYHIEEGEKTSASKEGGKGSKAPRPRLIGLMLRLAEKALTNTGS
jgi:hypothetical protein